MDEQNVNIKKEDTHEATEEFFLFELDGELHAVSVGDVDQVIKVPPITSVPNAPDAIAGIFHLSGRVVVVLDLLKRMHLTRNTSIVPYYLFVAHREKNYFAILIDRPRTVVHVPLSEIMPLDPVVAAHIPPRYAKGMFMYQDNGGKKVRPLTPDIMIEPVSQEKIISLQQYMIRPVLWLNIEVLLNQEDILNVEKSLTDL